MIRGCIFDLDGTILDSMEYWETAGARFLRSHNIEPRPDLRAVQKTMSLRQSAEYYRDHYGLALSVEAIMQGVLDMVRHYYEDDVQLKPDISDFLRQLQAQGVVMCIATATDKPLVEAALKRCGVFDCFTDILTCNSVGFGKDRPEIYRAALRVLGTKKEETLVFEDALYATKTAKADGFTVVGVADPFEEDEVQLREISDLFLDDYRDFDGFWKTVN